MPSEPEHLAVFVYGTLRPGRVNWGVVSAACHHHEPARLAGHALYDLDHPGVVERGDPWDPAAPAVAGDLLWFAPPTSAEVLDRLDRFEGFSPRDPRGSYYVRERRSVVTDAGPACDAWVYLPGEGLLAQVREDLRVPGDEWRG